MTDTIDLEATDGQIPINVDAAKPMRLYLVDGSGYIFRAFHALPQFTRKSDGLPTGAVAGFCNMLWKFICEMRAGGGETGTPTHLAVIFDASEKTFRSQIYPEYKAHRPPPPPELVPQFPLTREATRAFGVPAIELDGYEADDLIASYAKVVSDAGGEVVIVSSDKDLMQLVNEQVCMFDPMKNLKICREQVIEKFGLGPEMVIDIQSLAGDSVDNVPGAPGIGIKTAAQLLTEFGDLDTLLARAHEIKQPKKRETLIEFADQVRTSRELVRLKTDAPLPMAVTELGVREPDGQTLAAFLEAMEFRTLARRVAEQISGVSPSPAQGIIARTGVARPILSQDAIQIIDPTGYACITDLSLLERGLRAHAKWVRSHFDTETDALGSSSAGLCGVSLAISPGEAAYIPVGHCAPNAAPAGGFNFGDTSGAKNNDEWIQASLNDVIDRLKPLLEDPAVLKIGHNAKYDIAVLKRYGINVAPIDDTMLISYVLEGGLHGHGMDELSQLHLGHTPIPFKQVAGVGQKQISFAQVELKPATAYAAEDADVTLRLWRALKPRLRAEGLLNVYETLERGMPAVLSAMELEGVKVDANRLRTLGHEFSLKMIGLEAKAHEQAGRPFSLGSPKQIGDILFGEMALPGAKKTATGAWATDAKVLEDLAEQGIPYLAPLWTGARSQN